MRAQVLDEKRAQIPKKSYTDEQIAFALRQEEAATTVGEICRKMGAAEATFYRWKRIFLPIRASAFKQPP